MKKVTPGSRYEDAKICQIGPLQVQPRPPPTTTKADVGDGQIPLVIGLEEASGFFPYVWKVLLAYSEAEADAFAQHTVALFAPAVPYSPVGVKHPKDQLTGLARSDIARHSDNMCRDGSDIAMDGPEGFYGFNVDDVNALFDGEANQKEVRLS